MSSSSSPGELQPVFAAMLDNAARVCDAEFGDIYRWDGDALYHVAAHDAPPALVEARKLSPRRRPDPNDPLGRMLTTKTLIHVADLTAEVPTLRNGPGESLKPSNSAVCGRCCLCRC